MIEGNVIKFGYGDIVVTSGEDPFIVSICCEQISPSTECGTDLSTLKGNIKFINYRMLHGSFEEFNELLDHLKLVHERKINSFAFKNYELDFTKYNSKSVDILINKVQVAIQRSLMCYAV